MARGQGSLRALLVGVPLLLGAAAAYNQLRRLLAQRAVVEQRRKARKERAGPSGTKVLQLVLASCPDLKEGSKDAASIGQLITKMNQAFKGSNSFSFQRYGTPALAKEALLHFLERPDMSAGLTHGFIAIADDLEAVKLALHSSIHLQEWFMTAGPHCRWCVEAFVELGIDLPVTGKDPMLQIVLLHFKPDVTEDSALYSQFQELVNHFNVACPGVAACLRPLGHGTLVQEDLIEHLYWKDGSLGYTHCLVVSAPDPEQLKALHASQVYQMWLGAEMPHLEGSRPGPLPPAIVYYSPAIS